MAVRLGVWTLVNGNQRRQFATGGSASDRPAGSGASFTREALTANPADQTALILLSLLTCPWRCLSPMLKWRLVATYLGDLINQILSEPE